MMWLLTEGRKLKKTEGHGPLCYLILTELFKKKFCFMKRGAIENLD